MLCFLVIISSCSNTKYLQEGQSLYTGAEIKLESEYPIPHKKELKEKLESVLQPEPNASLLWMRPNLWVYNVAGTTKKKKGIRHYIKTRLGNPPVLYEDVNPDFVEKLIENRLHNNGYFNTTVDWENLDKGRKKISLLYTAKLEKPYRYDSIFYPIDTHFMGKYLRDISEKSLIHSGDIYSLQNLRDERQRISRMLKNKGFYYFDDEYIHIQADTTDQEGIPYSRGMDIYIGMDERITPKASQRFFIKDINIHPSFTLGKTDSISSVDTTQINGFTYIDNDEENEFRPQAIIKKINFRPGKYYSTYDHEYTINRLMGMGAFKFVDVRFEELNRTTDTSWLKASIFMTPLPKKTISGRLSMISKSNNYAGPGLEIAWKHRNAFGGAELFSIQVDGGFETQFWGNNNPDILSDFRSYQFGARMDLSIPSFLVPFRTQPSSKYVPKTLFGLSYELVNRLQFFRLSSTSFTYGYYWRETDKKEHELRPFILRYLTLSNVSNEFRQLLNENPFLERSFAEQFIIGPEYTYTFNNQVDDKLRNHFYLTASGDFSNPFTLFGPDFSTYYRFSTDLRYYLKVNDGSKLVSRLAGGIGVPYGDSESLPYVKQFFTGGPNSIRSFRARTVGPGSTDSESMGTALGFQDQNGNIKLEMNLEYRFDIYSLFKGAIFADAGNIWLLEEEEGLEGGKFESKDFLTELAVGAGFGLRMDISYFVLRFDLAWPIRKPSLPQGERWTRPFRDENPVLNVAIGYPF